MPGRSLSPEADPCADARAQFPAWLVPDWRADGVGGLMTTRAGGVSRDAYASMNLGDAVGDESEAVATNRLRFERACGAAPVFLRQVHGRRVVRVDRADLERPEPHEADASVATTAGVACVVLIADCLPILLVAPGARGVAAVHAGWRGLAAGVVEATVRELTLAASCEPGELQAWLGASIGPHAFEVGADVLEAFGASRADVSRGGDRPSRFAPFRAGKWLADLPGLARDRLHSLGIDRVTGGDACTVGEPSRFFSYRRDGVTGRMAAAVWIERGAGSSA